MARRFLPVILPGALLFAAAAALGGTPRRMGADAARPRAIGVAFVALLAVHYTRAAQPVLPHVEYAGIIPRLEALAARIGDRDLLIVESRNAVGHARARRCRWPTSTPATCSSSTRRRPDKAAFAAFLDWARTRYDGCCSSAAAAPTCCRRPGTRSAIASERFQVPEYDAPADAYPRFVRHKEFDYGLYELTPPEPASGTLPFDLDVGVNDDLHVVRFHAKEQTEGRTFRWSRGALVSSSIDVSRRQPRGRAVDERRWTPAAAAAGRRHDLARQRASSARRVSTRASSPTRFAIPPALAARLRSGRRADRADASRRRHGNRKRPRNADDRDLGVMVDRVTVR